MLVNRSRFSITFIISLFIGVARGQVLEDLVGKITTQYLWRHWLLLPFNQLGSTVLTSPKLEYQINVESPIKVPPVMKQKTLKCTRYFHWWKPRQKWAKCLLTDKNTILQNYWVILSCLPPYIYDSNENICIPYWEQNRVRRHHYSSTNRDWDYFMMTWSFPLFYQYSSERNHGQIIYCEKQIETHGSLFPETDLEQSVFISDYNIVSNIGISDVKECCIKD